MRIKTRAISEGAMLLSLLAVLLILNYQFASLLALAFFLWSIPYIIYSVKYGMAATVVFACSSLVLAFMITDLATLFYLLSATGIGLLYAFGIKKQLTYGKLLCLGCIASALLSLVSVLLLGQLLGYDWMSEVAMLEKMLTTLVSVPTSGMHTLVVGSVLWTYVAMACLQAFIVQQLAQQLLKRFHLASIPYAKKQMALPKWIGIVCLLCGCLMVFVEIESALLRTLIGLLFVSLYYICVVDGAICIVTMYSRWQNR